ncbi:hypothetical protein FACS1894166_12260 [Bacilli bacterium]|nr:hypothetical protein FACS1894166_12260 [Bacilli bacterium]
MGFFEYCKKYLKQVCQKQKLSTPETEIFFDSNIRLYGCKTQKEHLFSTHPNVRLNLWSFLQVEEELNMTIIHELGHCVYPLGHHKLF